MEAIDVQILQDLLGLGSLGFVAGVAFPWAFRLIGYVIDSVRAVLD